MTSKKPKKKKKQNISECDQVQNFHGCFIVKYVNQLYSLNWATFVHYILEHYIFKVILGSLQVFIYHDVFLGCMHLIAQDVLLYYCFTCLVPSFLSFLFCHFTMMNLNLPSQHMTCNRLALVKLGVGDLGNYNFQQVKYCYMYK